MPNSTLLRLIIIALVSTTTAAVYSQDAATASSASDARSAYDQAADNYKTVFAEIETLRGEYQNADAARRQAINAQLPGLLNQAREKMQAWTASALELYKAEPNQDEQVSQLLVGMAKHFTVGETPRGATGGDYAGGDQYELAMPILQALIEGGHPEKQLLMWGGVAAVCVNDYDAAETYLNAADEAGLFDGLPPYPSRDMAPEKAFPLKARDFHKNLAQLREWWEAEQAIRADESAADDLPRVKFTTTKGDVVIELFENQAPIAAANMLSLVKDGFYSNVVFHRVLPHFMAQGGDPTGSGSGGPGYNIACECYEPDARKHFRGTLSMAHAGRDTGGSQFFMCFVPTDFLNGRHTAFGRVVEGMEVLGKLQRIDPQAQGPAPTPDKIIKAEVLRDRGHDYEFQKLPGR